MTSNRTVFLGKIPFRQRKFPEWDLFLKEKKNIARLQKGERFSAVNHFLLHWIQQQPEPSFLLPEVLDFVDQVQKTKTLPFYTFSSFELFLNQLSGLSFEENYRVRAKVAGKSIERSAYRVFFPIGMGKVYAGTHFVTAHKSPDLDTTIASFWGWLDAFGARVGDGLHIWNVPGGPPSSQIEIEWLFCKVFGRSIFTNLAKTRSALSLDGRDLVTQKGFVCRSSLESLSSVDHAKEHFAVAVIDEEGRYLGDWRDLDVEQFRMVVNSLSSCLRWFENRIHMQWIALFAQKNLQLSEVETSLKALFKIALKDCEPAREFTALQSMQVEGFLVKVLQLSEGLETSFSRFIERLGKLAHAPFQGLKPLLDQLRKSELFDAKGYLRENRSKIFSFFEKVIERLHEGILQIRMRLEKLDVALLAKREVLEKDSHFLTLNSDIEEIHTKMGSYLYLTVTHSWGEDVYPLGIVSAAELRKKSLGTVSLRDFCNREEMGIPSYLEVISVIDHHKSSLQTLTPPLATLADVQSCNTLVAQKAFQINDCFSLGGQTLKSIQTQIRGLISEQDPVSLRLLSRLLQKQQIALSKKGFFVHPKREFLEYLHFLYAILDDTDLLSKVTDQDVECVVSLLNRLKSLQIGKETEILSLDGVERGKDFAKKAAQHILQHPEMYSLYRGVYAHREKQVEEDISLLVQGKDSQFFADTKEQNGCCRVGQSKIFDCNLPVLEKNLKDLRTLWWERAQESFEQSPELDLHIHMISTIVSAEEVYRGRKKQHKHQDQMWLWIAPHEGGVKRLKRFLTAFQSSPGLQNNRLEVEFLGENADNWSQVFHESFVSIPQKRSKGNLPIAVLFFEAGSLNSRKAMISPFLPSLT